MGQGPLTCQKCENDVAVNKVLYENSDVTKNYEKCNPYKVPMDLKNLDIKGMFEILDFAIKETQKIEAVVGKISVSQGIDIKMEQVLCRKCLKKVKFQNLPPEWKHIVFHNNKGYYKSELP